MNLQNTLKSELDNLKTTSSPELKWAHVMEENRRDFEWKYGTLVDSLTHSLSLETGFMRSLIAHESRFKATAQNEHGSKGFMQLTSAPINDLLARPDIFTPIIRKIWPGVIPADAPEPLQALKRAFDTQPINIVEIARVIPLLQKLKKDPVTNLVIGHVFFAALEAREGPKIEKRESRCIKTVQTIIQNPTLTAHVFKRVNHLLPWVSPEKVIESLQWLQQDSDMRSQFLAIKDYNGNKHPYSAWVVHSDIYACTIMSVQTLANTEPKYAKRILGPEKVK